MKTIISPGKFAAALITAFLLTGCGGQDEPEGASAPSASNVHSEGSAGAPIEGTYAGTQSISLDRSGEMSQVWVSLTCISPGTLSLQDGAQMECQDGGEGTTSTVRLDLTEGQDEIQVRTSDESTEYRVKIAFESR